MRSFKDEERLRALRERLYSRGKGPESREKYTLTADTVKEAPTSWEKPPSIKKTATDTVKTEAQSESTVAATQQSKVAPITQPEIAPIMTQKKNTRKYRLIIVLSGLVFFILSVLASSLFFFTGNKGISGENIAISLNGPFTIGGGETIPLQIGITNQNTVPIESATLIVTYPSGTQSASGDGTELFIERLPFEAIKQGETLNIPLRAIVFGEENEEKIIEAEIEYRVEGSNSTFAKEAEPLRFKISSSPVVISVDALHKISSGQETNIELTISSNAPNTLTDVLVKAEYPTGFDFTNSEPEPVSGQNVWLIDSLGPEESTTITLTGVVVGKETDAYVMHFSIGISNERDRLSLSSVFSTASTEFAIEQPFIDVALELNGKDSATVAVEAGESIDVDVVVSNSLEDTIYDGRVELSLSGNALSDFEVDAGAGFYDSIKNTVFWEAANVESLREIVPGQEVSLGITLKPDPDIETTPQLAFDVDVRARRVTEGRASEELIGTAAGVAKVSSVAILDSGAGINTGTFADTGPLPPVAENKTTYTLTLFTQNGSNDLGDVEVTASLPVYIEWLDKTSGAGTITFNDNSRVVTWNVGDVDANQSKIAAFQVSLLPSISQIGTTPTLLGEQRLRGTDRFTDSVVRTNSSALTTRLSEDAGYPERIGEVLDAAVLEGG
ncbi:hypothetical protein N8083_01640 [Candidatus Pacebacteria bacterium]|nr:hypothetical protein [Candidatus Paceibacterota bacterium]